MTNTTRVIDMSGFPEGGVPAEAQFEISTEPIPEPAGGEVLARTLYLRMDPGARSKMVPPEESPYEDTWVGDEPVNSGGLGEVVESNHPDVSVGDVVMGRFRWAEYDVLDGDEAETVAPEHAPIQARLHVLGHTGRTAYFGLTDIGDPSEGETLVVSAAAGSVGSVAAQLGKIYSCRVVGIAGSDEKVAHLVDELNLDAAINYADVADLRAKIADVCPEGVDIYFDNVGGEISDAVFNEMNIFGRIVQCGRVALINAEGGETPQGPRHEGLFIKKRVRREGFVVYDYEDRYADADRNLAMWHREGKLRYRETIVEGLENAPEAFIGLFEGENVGKLLVKCADRFEQ